MSSISMYVVFESVLFICLWLRFFFFFKQKTAYEMRISDWSSDVCSSDLIVAQRQEPLEQLPGIVNPAHQNVNVHQPPAEQADRQVDEEDPAPRGVRDRKSVV